MSRFSEEDGRKLLKRVLPHQRPGSDAHKFLAGATFLDERAPRGVEIGPPEVTVRDPYEVTVTRKPRILSCSILDKWVRLPMPATLSKYWRFPPGTNKRYISKPGLAFRRAVARMAERYGHEDPVTGPVTLQVMLCFNRTNCDLDNRMKGLLDSLQHAGIILDDKQIDQLFVLRGPKKGGPGECYIRLSRLEKVSAMQWINSILESCDG